MTHAVHPDVHDYGLADDCEACAEHAAKPFHNLDEAMIQDLAARTLSNRFGYGYVDGTAGRLGPRSANEDVAMTSLLNVLEQVGRFAECAPKELEWYLRVRWKIECEIHGSEQ